MVLVAEVDGHCKMFTLKVCMGVVLVFVVLAEGLWYFV